MQREIRDLALDEQGLSFTEFSFFVTQDKVRRMHGEPHRGVKVKRC